MTSIGGCVICISNKVEYLDKEGSYTISTKYQKSCIIILNDVPNALKKMLDKISFHKHFNKVYQHL